MRRRRAANVAATYAGEHRRRFTDAILRRGRARLAGGPAVPGRRVRRRAQRRGCAHVAASLARRGGGGAGFEAGGGLGRHRRRA